MTATYIALATITLTSTDSEIVFSSIPATYRDLVLVTSTAVHNNGSSNRNLLLRLNGDTGSNYTRVVMSGYPTSSTGSIAPGAEPYANLGWQVTNNNATSNHTVQIMDYAQTNKHKTMLTRSNGGGATTVEASAHRWANTNAVNSLTVYFESFSFAVGSTFSLYGIN